MLNTESSEDLQPAENINKTFPKLTPQSLRDTFPTVQSPILSKMGVSARLSECGKHEIWGVFTV